ncbi:MAG: hypothetical protein HY370_09280 [Proteobacteria bacterium]|nr:hypothetical protein [Pseudomonadota bacterium]
MTDKQKKEKGLMSVFDPIAEHVQNRLSKAWDDTVGKFMGQAGDKLATAAERIMTFISQTFLKAAGGLVDRAISWFQSFLPEKLKELDLFGAGDPAHARVMEGLHGAAHEPEANPKPAVVPAGLAAAP